jgi:SAM-dependent methyltransferase
MVDWGKGHYERTAAELAPVAEAVVAAAAPQAGERVLDIACGTGNAALLAAARGAEVIGVDAAPRLVEVARERARDAGVDVDFRVGDLLALPVPDGCIDVALSVFGVIFAADPAAAVGEIARVLAPRGRAYVSAWEPRGPIDAMVSELARTIAQVTGASPPPRFAWSDRAAVVGLAAAHGLAVSTTDGELAIRASSAAAYVDAGWQHPMVVDARPILEHAGAVDRLRARMIAALEPADEDPDGLLLHSPYVVHELRPRG